MQVRVAVLVPNEPTVSVDVKQHSTSQCLESLQPSCQYLWVEHFDSCGMSCLHVHVCLNLHSSAQRTLAIGLGQLNHLTSCARQWRSRLSADAPQGRRRKGFSRLNKGGDTAQRHCGGGGRIARRESKGDTSHTLKRQVEFGRDPVRL